MSVLRPITELLAQQADVGFVPTRDIGRGALVQVDSRNSSSQTSDSYFVAPRCRKAKRRHLGIWYAREQDNAVTGIGNFQAE
jgi:hypothetical protein